MCMVQCAMSKSILVLQSNFSIRISHHFFLISDRHWAMSFSFSNLGSSIYSMPSVQIAEPRRVICSFCMSLTPSVRLQNLSSTFEHSSDFGSKIHNCLRSHLNPKPFQSVEFPLNQPTQFQCLMLVFHHLGTTS